MEEEQNNQPINNEQTGKVKSDRKGFNITSMILGIIAVLGSCVWYINFPCAIIAIIFSVAGRKDSGRGMGIAGMVLGIIALVLYVVYILLVALGLAAIFGLAGTDMNELNAALSNSYMYY